MNRLNRDHLANLPKLVAVPQYRLTAEDCGILHLGLGQFSRGHLLDYLDKLLSSAPGPWGVMGVSLRSGGAAAELAAQDWLYTLIHQSETSIRAKVVGSLVGVIALGSQGDPDQFKRYLLSPNVRIVSLTVTEKGYYQTSEGRLNLMHPEVVADLKQPQTPNTAVGWIGLGLKLRLARGIAPFTAMSLDNIAGNGRVLRQVVLDYIDLAFPEIKSAVQNKVAFPCSMVDRIVPARNQADLALVQKTLDLSDQAVVVTEPFCQWVLEDCFAAGGPDWESVGVTLCSDIAPFETMKLRLLNGAHSAIAYVGLALGYETVAACMGDSAIVEYVSRLMIEEISPEVSPPPSVDLSAYVLALLERFKNPSLRHPCQQIAMDGSEKIQQRWLPVLTRRLARQSSISLMAFGLAAWVIYLQKNNAVQDPRRALLQGLLAGKPRGLQAATLIFESGIFSGTTPHLTKLASQVGLSLENIDAVGAPLALSELLRVGQMDANS